MIKTARMGETTNGVMLDITVKNSKNHVLAPTWNMVIGFMKGKISWMEYEKMYVELLNERLKTREQEFRAIIEAARTNDIYLVCFCKDERFCHRRLAKEFLDGII